MATIIERLHCSQLPNVTIIGIGSDPVTYTAHMQQIIGTLLNKLSSGAANASMHTFLKSNAGKMMQQGGDLVNASFRGPLTAMIYTHRFGVGAAKESYFLTMEGVKYVVDTLPNPDEDARQRITSLLDEHLLDQSKSKECFQSVPDDQNPPSDMEEDCIIDARPNNSLALRTAENRMLRAELFAKDELTKTKDAIIEAKETVIQAKETIIQAKDTVIQAKEAEITAERSLKSAEVARERAEKLAAQQETQRTKEAAEKDITIARLEMKLELAEERAKLRSEGNYLKPAKMPRTAEPAHPKKLNTKESLFTKLTSTVWKNDTEGVNAFVNLPHDLHNHGNPIFDRVVPILKVNMAIGIDPIDYLAGSDIKHRSFGFCYKGLPISRQAISFTHYIKEAYGTELDGVHYVCLILFKRFGRRLTKVSTLPFICLPPTVTPELIPGSEHHISIYKADMRTDDAVLEHLKRPSNTKWFWHSSVNCN